MDDLMIIFFFFFVWIKWFFHVLLVLDYITKDGVVVVASRRSMFANVIIFIWSSYRIFKGFLQENVGVYEGPYLLPQITTQMPILEHK